MAASTAVSSFTTRLIWNYQQVVEVMNLSGPSEARDMSEITSHDSPDRYREFLPSVISGGEVTLDGNLIVGDADGQVSFHTDLQGTTKRNCFLVMPMSVGASLYFVAFAKGFEAAFPFDNQIGITGSLQITGKPLLLVSQATGLTSPFLTGVKDGGVNTGNTISISPAVAQATYEYTSTVDSDTTGVKLTATCAGQALYIAGASETSGAQTGAIALTAGETLAILILCYTTATPPGTSPRLYTLRVTRPS